MIPFRLQSRPAHEEIPIPYITFVDKHGKPSWATTHPGRFLKALKEELCAACGQRVGKAHFRVFIVQPLQAIRHISLTLPMHMDCAQWMGCNFPTMRADGLWAAYVTRGFKVVRTPAGPVFLLGTPATREGITWYTEGRKATRDEVIEEFDKIVPLECDRIQKECAASKATYSMSMGLFERQYKAIVHWLPKEAEEPDKGEEWKDR